MRVLLLLVTIFVISCSSQTEKVSTKTRPVVMAYYVAERDYQPEKIPVEKLTHIIYSFTNVIDGEMKFRNPDSAGPKLKQLVEQKSRNPELKVMIACGGWGADGFSDMALTTESREKFIQSAYEFVEEYRLDGIDMDWEYPSISGAGTMARPEDKENFTHVMRGLREALDKTGRPQTLTFASAGWKRYYDNIELDEVMKYADYMNIMTYDQVSGNSIYTGHHTPLGAVSYEAVAGTPFGNYMDSLYQAGRLKDPNPRSAGKDCQFSLRTGSRPSPTGYWWCILWQGLEGCSPG